MFNSFGTRWRHKSDVVDGRRRHVFDDADDDDIDSSFDTFVSQTGIHSYDPDQLLLLPNQVLEMDSVTFCKDVATVAPCFISSNYNDVRITDASLYDVTTSGLLELHDNPTGLILTKAPNGCLWLCKFVSFALFQYLLT